MEKKIRTTVLPQLEAILKKKNVEYTVLSTDMEVDESILSVEGLSGSQFHNCVVQARCDWQKKETGLLIPVYPKDVLCSQRKLWAVTSRNHIEVFGVLWCNKDGFLKEIFEYRNYVEDVRRSFAKDIEALKVFVSDEWLQNEEYRKKGFDLFGICHR